MSVTFTPSIAPIVGYQLVDSFGGRSTTMLPTFHDAEAALVQHHASGAVLPGSTEPEEARIYGAYIEVVTADGDSAPSVNLSCANARHLLSVLGLGEGDDLAGVCDAGDFLGRVLLAHAMSPADEGVPATGDRVIDCGRRAGYTEHRLHDLEDLARWAIDHHRNVNWA